MKRRYGLRLETQNFNWAFREHVCEKGISVIHTHDNYYLYVGNVDQLTWLVGTHFKNNKTVDVTNVRQRMVSL